MPFDPGVDGVPGFGEPSADPAVYQDYVQNFPVRPLVWLAQTPRQARYSVSQVRGPIVVQRAYLPEPVAVALAKRRQIPPSRNSRQTPLISVTAASGFPTGPIVQLSRFPRRAVTTHSQVRPPTIVSAAVVTVLPQRPRVTLAKPGAFKPPTRFTVRKPTVVGSAVTFPGARVTLSRTPAASRNAHSKYRPPTVTGAAQTGNFPVGAQITLARTRPEYRPLLGLTWVAPPTVLTAPAAMPLFRVTLAPSLPRALRRTRSTLRPPTVIGAVTPTSFAGYPRTRLARTPRQARFTVSQIRGPIVVATPIVGAPPPPTRVTLAKPTKAGRSLYKIRPPAVVSTPVAAALPEPIRVTLALARPQVRTVVDIGGPTVIDAAPPTAPLRVIGATTPWRLLQTHSRRFAPVVVGTPAPPTLAQLRLRVTLTRRQWAVQPTHSKFPGPTVIGPPPTPPPAVGGTVQDMTPFIVNW